MEDGFRAAGMNRENSFADKFGQVRLLQRRRITGTL